MTWRESYLDASFRGAAFFVESADSANGRRVALHEYPLRDKPFAEDLGRKSRMINLEAILIGDDYRTARDALINAIEQAGPGTLVHPYYGEMQVTVISEGRTRETTREGGMARISLAFVEAGEFTYPAANADTSAAATDQADTTSGAAVSSFAGGFSVAGMPAFVSASALSTIGQVIAQVKALARFPLADSLARAGLDGLLGGLSIGAPAQLATPLVLGASVLGVIGGLSDAAPDYPSAVGVLVQLAAFQATPALAAPTTPSRAAEAVNRAALVELVGVGAVAAAAAAIAQVDFDSYDQAIALRDAVTAPIDALMDVTADDTVFAQLVALRAAVCRDVAARGADRARLVTITPAATLPAIVIAYGLYEDPERDVDILARNAIARPGFVPAGQSIEVPIDG